MSIVCPICGSTETVLRVTVSAHDSAQSCVPSDEDPKRNKELEQCIEALWEGSTAGLYECHQCQFGFTEPYTGGSPEYYKLAYPRSNYPSMKWEFQRTIDEFKKRGSIKSILEIGAGDGFFLDLIAPRYIKAANVWATEYYDHALQTLKSKGYNAATVDIHSDSFFQDKTFDSIFMFQVLEHMDSSNKIFETLNRLLTPGGDLFIAVPNKHRTQFNEDHNSIMDMPPSHIGRWLPSSFKAITQQNGLELIRTEFEPFSLTAFIKQDLYYSHRQRMQRLGSIAGRVRKIENSNLRKLAIIAEIMLLGLTRIPVWLAARRHGDLGGSLWAHIKKSEG